MDMSDPRAWFLLTEAQLMGYGESDSAGCWCKFQITPEELAKLRGYKGVRFALCLAEAEKVEGDDGPSADADHPQRQLPPREPNGPFSEQAQALFKSGWMELIEVIRQFTGDNEEKYKDWIRRQRSIISRTRDYVDEYEGEQGVMLCEYAHINRAGTTGDEGERKNRYSAVPLTRKEHALYHDHGPAALYLHRLSEEKQRELLDSISQSQLESMAKDWFEAKAGAMRAQYIKHRICDMAGAEHLYDADPTVLREWWGDRKPSVPPRYSS